MSPQAAFNAADFPLQGRRLIEASAGTGKTYNIANLYLRLLLGDHCTPRTVEQILVVTFTRAATSELRGRIRDKVELALQAFRGAACGDGFINALLARYAGEKKTAAARWLNHALLRMDEACIFTIHGFSVRAIQTFLFETGALADVEISEAGNARRDVLLADLWRQLQLYENPLLQQYADAADFSSLEKFRGFYASQHDGAEVLPAFVIPSHARSLYEFLPQLEKAMQASTAAIFEERQSLAREWHSIREEFCAAMRSGNSALTEMELNELLACIERWLGTTDTQLIIPARNKRPYNKLNPFAKGDGVAAGVIARLLSHAENSQPGNYFRKGVFRAFLLQYIRAKMQETDLASMQLDEVTRLINGILRDGGEKASQLREAITAAYPVCMVDEFQDTDPAQFEMFSRLYEDSNNTGFFMIGDPKQSIYQFRGADIFSYLGVRTQVRQQEAQSGEKHIFSLGTNFRSKAALVQATNRLFAEQEKPTFLFPGIDYVDVASCEDEPFSQDKGTYTVRHKKMASEPLVFVGNDTNTDDAASFNGDTLRWRYAHDTARRIALLLDTQHGATVQTGSYASRSLKGGDIAVLVRTSREAGVMRSALLALTPRIGSVFQSQRDSVFEASVIAEDIYHILCAMDEPGDRQLLKKAMATLLYRGFRTDFADLDQLDAGDSSADVLLEQLIDEFSAYRLCWEQYGVLAALNRFVQQRALMPSLALLPDGDRLVTDFRHLGELLQQQYLECSSREQLILWYARQLRDDSELDEDSKRIRLESDDNLVKIVTIHVSKGLEYPVVFLPFFFLPWKADSNRQLPLYHPAAQEASPASFRPRIDFNAGRALLEREMQKEILAEDMRLLYVAITRAIYQCYIGISAAVKGREKSRIFPYTVWANLLDMDGDDLPSWEKIRLALQKRLGENQAAVAYRELSDCPRPSSNRLSDKQQAVTVLPPALLADVSEPCLPRTHWIITSYTALAHARKEPGLQRGGRDELSMATDALALVAHEEDDARWSNDIRYRLKGSNRTGDCLHGFFEQLAREPALYTGQGNLSYERDRLLQNCLRKHGIEKPEGFTGVGLDVAQCEAIFRERRRDMLDWLDAVLDTALMEGKPAASLREIFVQGNALPELDFDFATGRKNPANIADGINRVLRESGVAGIQLPFRSELEGLVTGSIDLLFIHDKKVYVLDYKSNTLGKAPRFYDEPAMSQAMRENRYDLQYLIYSVAAHRYMQQRLGTRYDFDSGEYRFGGVFYLFLRGMGLPQEEYRRHGVWFHRPQKNVIEQLDAAFAGALPLNTEGVGGQVLHG
ncbi:MAG TPA: exodeoxyribonuclease V subunit beta [Pseudomonadales bacterium]|nr:exodeoxyribonuclease V subunit beta [Pseudomonadales bacterium]